MLPHFFNASMFMVVNIICHGDLPTETGGVRFVICFCVKIRAYQKCGSIYIHLVRPFHRNIRA